MENDLKSIREINLRTKSFNINLEVFEDKYFEDYLAKIDCFTPIHFQQIPPGGAVIITSPIQQQELRGKDQERLLKDCRNWIKNLDGEIFMDVEERQ